MPSANSTNAKDGRWHVRQRGVAKWIDQPIALSGTTATGAGTGMILAIRVRPTAPKAEPVRAKEAAS